MKLNGLMKINELKKSNDWRKLNDLTRAESSDDLECESPEGDFEFDDPDADALKVAADETFALVGELETCFEVEEVEVKVFAGEEPGLLVDVTADFGFDEVVVGSSFLFCRFIFAVVCLDLAISAVAAAASCMPTIGIN